MGAQSIVKEKQPKALYVHCSAHSLNLAITKSSEIQAIRNSIGILSRDHNFFNKPRRKGVLSKCIEEMEENYYAKSLKNLCSTRWVESFDAVTGFIELLDPIIEALTEISQWDDANSSRDAFGLRSYILQCEFLISLFVTEKVYSLGSILSKTLQKIEICLKEAIATAERIVEKVEELRENTEVRFKEVFTAVEKVFSGFGVPVAVHRSSKRRTNRPNQLHSDTESYFRITLYIPFLDSFIMQIKNRFTNHKAVLSAFQTLFPGNADDSEVMQSFRNTVNTMGRIFQTPSKIS
ncbi:hypothetical protein PR048_009392 [Dryococelus australis]|uniref:Uncharacterized protein n=1 Tax=Dryococelus australis TaxID=614101 RepID=A0ABQ9HZR7_9NEOP|nr:hypothetical protein PR048_009392 [Dryococelus australis]